MEVLKMSEEIKGEEKTTPTEKVFSDFIGSQDYINHINAEKSKWAKDFRDKEADTLRGSIREEVMKELNPEESPLEKEVRELREARKADIAEATKLKREKTLTKLAKEKSFEFGIDKVDRYASFGDDGETMMLEDFAWMQTTIDSEIDKRLKGSFSKETPSLGEKQEDDYDFKAAMKEKMNKLK